MIGIVSGIVEFSLIWVLTASRTSQWNASATKRHSGLKSWFEEASYRAFRGRILTFYRQEKVKIPINSTSEQPKRAKIQLILKSSDREQNPGKKLE